MATELWRWQGGTSGYDGLLGATVGLDGSSILAGYTMENAAGTSTNSSEWIAVKLDTDGAVQWQRQGGIAGFTPSDAAVMGEDGSVVMVGTAGEEPPNAAAVKFDEDGTLLWEWQDDSLLGTTVVAVSSAGDGSVILAGSASTDRLIGASRLLSDVSGLDTFTAWKLDAEGELVWTWKEGSSGTDKLNTAVVGDDDSVVLAGYTYGNWSGAKSEEFEADFAAVKLDADGSELWRWQDGTTTGDSFVASALGQDGSVVLAGVTTGMWGGAYAGGTYDFAAVKLDANGDEVWRWQDGTTGEDVFYSAAAGDDESFVLVGRTDGAWGKLSDDSVDFAAVMLDEDGIELWRWQDGSAEAVSDSASVIAAGLNGQMLVAGLTVGSWDEATAGGVDYVALMLDTEAYATPAPTTSLPASASPAAVAPTPTDLPATPAPTPGLSTSPPTVAAPSPSPTPSPSSPASPTPSPSSPASPTPSPSSPASPTPSPSSLTSPTPASPAKSPTRQPTFILIPSDPVRTAPPTTPTSPTPASSTSASLEPTSPAPTSFRRASPAPSLAAPPSSSESDFSSTNIGIVSAAATLAVVVAGACLRRKQNAKKNASVQLAQHSESVESGNGLGGNSGQASSATPGDARENTDPPPYVHAVSDTGIATADSRTTARSATGTDRPSGGGQAPPAYDSKGPKLLGVPPIADKAKTEPDTDTGPLSVVDSPAPPAGGSDVAKAVVEAAYNLSLQSQIPGVCEAATLVSILVNLVMDDQGNTAEVESRVKRCRLVVMILQRAAMVLGKGNDTHGEMERMLIEDVQAAVADMVELIKTYRSKGRISQVIVSTIFKRRMEETDAVIDRAISDLKLGLHVNAAVNGQEERQTVGGHLRTLQGLVPGQNENGKDTTEAMRNQRQASERKAVCMAAARRLRRQRNLNQIEIPEEHVTITDELLGKGGFGSVYIADYNGRNAAAKVIKIGDEHSEIGGRDDNDARGNVNKDEASRQRASLLLELQAMLRLRSPHTVNVYGAITSRKDRLVLVMELLTGGDLRSFLRLSEERLPEAKTRQIIGDVCAGMAFLHSKKAVHGDLKSGNILLDGEGRAKIGDFGTSRWAQHSDSTGLATYKTNAGDTTKMMSFAWAAPEVLDAKGSSYASDVYSFGIVAWEVLSRQVPWADEALPRDIYRRVVFKGDRPEMPADAPADIADIVRACWAGTPRKRPPASQINGRLRYFRLQEE